MSLTFTDLPAHMADRVTTTDSGCWEWQGWKNDADYGYVHIDGRDQCAHRVAYKALVGPIPEGLELDHLCINPPCVNPAHLEPVTHAENQRRIAVRQTSCRRAGHDWTDPKNVYTRPDGSRYCAECQRLKYAAEVGPSYRGAMAARTHCPRGHPYDEANTYLNAGRRHCRTCMKDRKRARRFSRNEGGNQ